MKGGSSGIENCKRKKDKKGLGDRGTIDGMEK